MQGADADMARERDLAPVGAVIGHPARAAMLAALAGGRALPAGELARHAAINPATATAHLKRLVDGGLVRVHVQGRHRYHELAGPDVAAALETLARLAPPAPVRSLRQDRIQRALAEARTCYDHLAGRLGVQLRDRLLADDALRVHGDRDHVLTDHGRAKMKELGLDADSLLRSRRVLARSCIDFSQRRPHLAGAIPAAITTRLLELGWLARTTGRGLRPAPDTPNDSTRGSPPAPFDGVREQLSSASAGSVRGRPIWIRSAVWHRLGTRASAADREHANHTLMNSTT